MRHRLAAGLFIVCVSCTVRADEDDELIIDKYQFTWTVAEVGKTQFLIVKDEKSTKAVLRHRAFISGGEIDISFEDAKAVGTALARTDEFFETLKDTKGQSERVIAGKIHVTFQTNDDGKFHVEVTPDKWMRVFATLTRAEAKALAGPMKKAVQAGALVDRKVKL